jgi:TatD DNase family protein
MIDTHSHIYAEEFDADIDETIQRAKDAGVQYIILPNVDSESHTRMLKLEEKYADYCFAAIGLHPTSVNANYQSELKLIKSELERRKFIAIGEIGIDLFWDKTFFSEQIFCFQQQLDWALEYNLPVIIHIRDSFNETMQALEPYKNRGLRGVFHSFTGTKEQATQMLNFNGFMLGINGIITFKNSGLSEVIQQLDIKNILLETDSPYLTPTPFRGKRNESAYLKYICSKIAETKGMSTDTIQKITTKNANELFNFGLKR